jgi:hypothetical protein
MANSSLQVLKIVKSGYVLFLFLFTPPLFTAIGEENKKRGNQRGRRKEGKKEEKS